MMGPLLLKASHTIGDSYESSMAVVWEWEWSIIGDLHLFHQ
jgi:hypothetical protein